MPAPPLFDVRPDVAAALDARRPVVALVSTPVAHTLPWPVNVETARAAEDAARREGAVLALIAVCGGRLAVGLDAARLEALCRGGDVTSANRRELVTVVHRKATAATTASASMYVARTAGIRLVAAGAIGTAASPTGGVNEGPIWNVSSDLVELQHTAVALVCAGGRTVHHLGSTAGVLDTFRVPVVGYQTDRFPTFYLRRGGTYPTSARADSPAEVAELLATHWALDGAGLVVAQQTPADAALSPDELIPALDAVERQAAETRAPRRDLSRLLMERLNRLTAGKAVRTYQAALVANARLAAQVAVQMAAG
jgi:pseudouridine-5'-phosphate glycosidase